MGKEKFTEYLWWHKKAARYWWVMLVVILIACSYIFVDFILGLFGVGSSKNGNISIDIFHAVAIVIFTGLILIFAWFQANEIRFHAKNISRVSKTDFLLRIDREYGSNNIIKARIILHEFYCQAFHKNVCMKKRNEIVGDAINNMRNNNEQADNFILLRNFLDFLETAAYFCRKKDILKDDVKELIGDLNNYHEIFKKLICSLRIDIDKKDLYIEIENFSN